MQQLKIILPYFDIAVRFYIAFFFIDYGIAKFTGNMFHNTSQEVLNTKLADVDMFHLTWYWFGRNRLLTYVVGFLQILSATLLIFKRTVLLGVLIAVPILINILLIDIYCVGMPALVTRVSLYLFLVLSLFVVRIETTKKVWHLLLKQLQFPVYRSGIKRVITILSLLLFIFLIEFILIELVNLF